VARAIRETADRLGNTIAASRRACIHPGVIRVIAPGAVVRRVLRRPNAFFTRRGPGLYRSERALLELLRRDTK
jgi:DNA topoisomerase IB